MFHTQREKSFFWKNLNKTSQTKKFDAHESKNNVQITDSALLITNSGNYLCLSIETDLGIPVPCAR